jgi:divalent metal cation (Fe/Co/Zn/Cd) transporter
MGMLDLSTKDKLYRAASFLAFITVAYNIVEGIVSAWFGAGDESLALFGFGLDSFVEVVSGAGIWHMVSRQRVRGEEEHDVFERRALKITGYGFYVLAAGLLISGCYDIYSGHAPKTTLWGIIVSCVSIVSMWLLIQLKVKVGKGLGSQAILADAACTRVCLYLSLILLVSSVGYELSGVGWLDAVGALWISWFSFKEGREALEKARGGQCSCSCSCGGK